LLVFWGRLLLLFRNLNFVKMWSVCFGYNHRSCAKS
jgi:hypothetical protein